MGGLDEKRRAAQERWSQRTQGDLPVIFVGTASCGRAAGALETLQAVRATLVELGKDAHIVEVGCIGPCYLEPLMDVALPGQPRVSYANVTPAKARKILTACLVEGDLLPKQAKGHFGDAVFTQQTGIQRFFDLPMLKPQVRIILKNCGLIDPEDFDAALAAGAYRGFERALSLGPEGIIAELKGIRAARARRGGLSHLEEMGAHGRGSGKTQICGLQRRRGRSGRVYEPLAARKRSARRAGGDADRRPGDWGADGDRLRARRVPAGGGAPGAKPSTRCAPPGCWARISSARVSTLRSASRKARGRLCAAKRPP